MPKATTATATPAPAANGKPVTTKSGKPAKPNVAVPKGPVAKKTPAVPGKAWPARRYPLSSEIRDLANAIDAEEAKDILGWEEEPEGAEWGDAYDFLDVNQKKVRCFYNSNNRPFERDLARKYAYEFLNLNWAGPTSMPGLTVNGEPVILSETGRVISAQHRLIGIVFAWQIWTNEMAEWKKNWPTQPVLETVLTKGISDNTRVTRTVDCVRPRTGADTLYATGMFRGKNLDGKKVYTKGDTKNLCKIADNAVKEAWYRTGVDAYLTQSEVVGFLEGHPKLQQCVRHVYDFPGEKGYRQYLTNGYAAAVMYLMAASATDGDKYRAAYPRTEKKVDFANWDKAVALWEDLVSAKPKNHELKKARYPQEGDKPGVANYSGHVFPDGEGKTTPALKMYTIAKFWQEYLEGKTATKSNVTLNWNTLHRDTRDELIDAKLIEKPSFGGIDVGEVEAKDEDEPRAKPAKPASDKDIITIVRENNPGKVLVFRSVQPDVKDGKPVFKSAAVFRTTDVPIASKVFDLKADVKNQGSLQSCRVPADIPAALNPKVPADAAKAEALYLKHVEAVVAKLNAAGYECCLVTPDEKGTPIATPIGKVVKATAGTSPKASTKKPNPPKPKEPEPEEFPLVPEDEGDGVDDTTVDDSDEDKEDEEDEDAADEE